jgi:aminoglycoside phosphotransferase (APT) family kinase protein
MDSEAEISSDRIGAWLGAHVAGFHGLRSVTKFAAGQSNPTYLVEAASGHYVLRAKPTGPLLASAHQVDREYRVMAALAGSDVPVPHMLALAPDATSPIGRAFFVMEHLQGRIFWDPALPELPRGDRAGIYAAMCGTLAALHCVDPVAVGLGDFGKPGSYFARQADRWTRQYHASCTSPDPRIARVIAWLAAHAPEDDGQVALVHGDYRLDNMIFAPDAPLVIGLLDWELSTLGHPMADLAYQCMQWRLPHDAGMRGLGGLDRAALGLPTEAAYVADYCARRGIDGITDWRAWLILAFFRLAAILQGVVARAEAGNASNPETARRYAAAIPVLAEMAYELAGKAAE